MKPLVLVLSLFLVCLAIGSASAYYVWCTAGTSEFGSHYYTGTVGHLSSESYLEYSETATRNTASVGVLNIAGGGEPNSGMTISNVWKNCRSATDPGIWYLMLFAEADFPSSQMQIRLWGFRDIVPAGNWTLNLLYDAGAKTWGRQQVAPDGGFSSTGSGYITDPDFVYTVPTKISTSPATDWGYIFELRPVPEPSAFAALAVGLACLPIIRRRRR